MLTALSVSSFHHQLSSPGFFLPVDLPQKSNYDLGKIVSARVITEFEAGISTRTTAVLNHHDQRPSVQNTKVLAIAFQDAGNHVDDSSDEFVIIDARDAMRDNVARIIMRAHGEGQKDDSTRYPR